MPTADTPLSPEEWQQLARDECGQPDTGDKNLVAAYAALDKSFPQFWRIYADKQSLGGLRLRYLYTKRHAIEFLIGQIWQSVDYTDEIQESVGDFVKNLQGLMDSVDALIEKAETRSAGVRGPAVGQIQATAPIMGHGCGPDPNDRRYRGDPLRGGPFRRW